MVTLKLFIREQLALFRATVLAECRRAREHELPMYRERFHARVPDPGDMLRHSSLSHIAFMYVEKPTAFVDAWSALRQLGKSGAYAADDVDKQIDIMFSELDEIEAEVNRLSESGE